MQFFKKRRFKPVQRSELAEYLREPIKKFGWDPSISPEELEQSRLGLVELLLRAQEMLPRSRLVHIGLYDRPLHDCNATYLYLLLNIKMSLVQKRWNDACSDLLCVLHSYHIEDTRVLSTVIDLLENNLS